MILREYIENHLEKRGIDLKNPEKYPVFVDTTDNVAYFPLFNLSGQFTGYQRYNPKGVKFLQKSKKALRDKNLTKDDIKYYGYFGTENDDFKKIKKIGVYGLHTIDKRPYIILVEGIFDTISLIRLGYPVIATMTNDPKQLKNFLFILQKKIIAILDNDPITKSGNKLKKAAHKAYKVPDPYKDVNEMPINDLKKFMRDVVKL